MHEKKKKQDREMEKERKTEERERKCVRAWGGVDVQERDLL